MSDTQRIPLRRSTRLNLHIPVSISGKLPDGKPFEEETHILTVSKYGAKIKTKFPFKVGMEVKLKPKQRRDSAPFRVVWVADKGSPWEGEVGIEYVMVSNLLGATFPE